MMTVTVNTPTGARAPAFTEGRQAMTPNPAIAAATSAESKQDVGGTPGGAIYFPFASVAARPEPLPVATDEGPGYTPYLEVLGLVVLVVAAWKLVSR